VGWHVDPLARLLVQSPAPPFEGAPEASQGFAAHVAAVTVPALHVDAPDTVYPELHVGWHVDPLARLLVQSPAPPFEGAPKASQGFAAHVAVVSVPELQDDVPDTVYPGLHVGWHVDPLASELVQSPAPPFEGAPEASQGFAAHVAAVTVPALHVDAPETVYPSLHVGWHVDPLASELVQVPTPPCVGSADASHGLREHVAAVTVPKLHVDAPETVYPSLHVGWHVDPLASELVQVPTPPCVGSADASQFESKVQMFPKLTTAASLVPSLDEVMPFHCFAIPVEVTSFQLAPESAEVQRFPLATTAASLVPSLEDVMSYQYCVLPTEVSLFQLAPELVEVQMFPLETTAASLVPYSEDVMLR
jgi:hypothetical protein